ncbi:hypothetical protein ACH5BF_02880 [Arcobacter sp. YIC-464]|uniref:hypothetical protein n=1 Tax=Arcobacter sp. YIC-464 TaxID=3376631 RepID=UPI003C1EC82C
MKKSKLLLILFLLIINHSLNAEDNIKSNKKIDLNLSLEEDRYSKYKDEKYLAPPPTTEESKKLKDDDIEIGGEIEVDKVTKEVEKLKLDISKKF